MKAYLFVRVSTVEQEESGLSLDSQIARTKEYALKKGLTDYEVVKIVETASKTEQRRKFNNFLNDALEYNRKTGEKVIVIADTVDRITRNFFDAVTLEPYRKKGIIELHTIRESLALNEDSNSSQLMQWDMSVLMAKMYASAISDNVKRSIEQSIRNGEIFSKASFGYKNVRGEDERAGVVKKEPEASIVKQVHDLYLTNQYSVRGIRKIMSERYPGIKLPKIERILDNKFYHGIAVYKKKGLEYVHRYERIVDSEVYDQVQLIKTGRRPDRLGKTISRGRLECAYRGILKCDICGRAMTPEVHKKGKYIYYFCGNPDKHPTQRVNEVAIDKQFKDLFRRIQVPKEYLPKIKEELGKLHKTVMQNSENLKDNFLAQIKKTELMESRTYDLYISQENQVGSITPAFYEDKLKEYAEKKAKLRVQYRQISETDDAYYQQVFGIVELASKAHELFELSNTEEKRELISLVSLKCSIKDGKLQVTLVTPFSYFVNLGVSPTMGG